MTLAKRKDKFSSSKKKKKIEINKKPRLVRVGGTWQRKNNNDIIIKNKQKRLIRDGDTWKRIACSSKEIVSPQKGFINVVSQIKSVVLEHVNGLTNMDSDFDVKNRSLSQNVVTKFETLKGKSFTFSEQSLSGLSSDNIVVEKVENRIFEKEDEQTSPTLKEPSSKLSIENNLYRYKLSQNTFLPVGFQVAEEILGYLDAEDLISVSLTYKPINKFITNSEKLWRELYKELSTETMNSIMKPLIMVQTFATPELKPSVAWKRQVFCRLKYRPIYVAFTYLDNSNDFTISFPGASYDLSTVKIEAYQYARYEEESLPANFVQHNTQIFDSLQEGFDEWRIAIEPIKVNLSSSLKLEDGKELFIVYNYMDVDSDFQFNFLKIFDDENEAIKFAESLSDLDDDNYAKNVNHTGEIFDCKHKFIKDFRIAVDIVKFWSKVHQNRNLPNSFIKEEEEVTNEKGKGREEYEVEDDTNFIEQWKQMGLMDKTYIQEVMDDIIYKSNQRKRPLEYTILDMELNEPSSSRHNKQRKLY